MMLFLLMMVCTAAQAPPEKKNPFEGDAAAAAQGRSLFRLGCAYCHGIDARGGRGPDLASGRSLHGSSDADLFRTISKGIPGTQMPPGDFSDDEVWTVVAYLRSLSSNAAGAVTGNREVGERIFTGEGMCSQCHMVAGRGGRLGPDLTRVGAARAARFLVEKIRQPEKEVTPGFDMVTVVTKEGRRVSGARKNEDLFSIQIMDTAEELQLFLKKDLKQVVYEKKSLMPGFGERALSEAKLNDLIAYLDSLRGRR